MNNMNDIHLDYNERRLIITLINHPDTKFSSQGDLFELNYMASLGLVRHAGGIRYEVTEDGKIAYERSLKDKDLVIDKKY